MREERDDVIKQKTGALDTLAAGIVFGKEAAWERVQGRMDAAPRKNKIIKYGLAAGIVLCIACGGIIYLQHSLKETATKAPRIVIKAGADSLAETRPAVISSLAATSRSSGTNNYPLQKKKDVPDEQNSISVNTDAAPMQGNENKPATNADSLTASQRKALPGVIPGNGLTANKTLQMQQTVISAAPAATVSKMKVIHINDLRADGYQKILEEKQAAWQDSIALNRRAGVQAGNGDYAIHHILKIKFNAQN